MPLSGDTIFPGSHGRCDLEESEPESLFSSDGVRRVAELQDDLRIYPGHTYGGRHTTVGREREAGMLAQVRPRSNI